MRERARVHRALLLALLLLTPVLRASASRPCGDAGGDGRVGSADVQALRVQAALDDLASLCLAVFEDGSCDLADVVRLARAVAGRGPGPRCWEAPLYTGTGQEPALGDADADAAAVYEVDDAPGASTVLGSGEKRLERVDLRIRGRGLHFEMRRTYRSQLAHDGPLGFGWSFAYDERLYPQAGGDVIRLGPSGLLRRWTALAGGAFTPPAGQFGTLRQEPDGSFTLREPDGLRHRYDASGRLVALRDRHGNEISFTHDAAGNLATAIDVFGRVIEFEFTVQADGRERLVAVRDSSGREVRYSYTPAGDLEEVRSPVVVGTSTGNDFPDGRTERYGYREGTGTELDHGLISVTRPQEVALGGPPAVRVVYGETPGTIEHDRVVSEQIGGTNASGVPAGGTVVYAYAELNQGAGPDPSLPRLEVTVTERNGNQREVGINELDHAILERPFTRGLRPGEPASYETTNEYDADGQLTRRVLPLGNEVQHTYADALRAAQRNRIETRWIPDPARGGSERIERWTYEPLYQQLASHSDPRENDPAFVPPNGGTSDPGRYTRRWIYDYQEGSAPVAEATEWGLDLSGVARGLGDLNGDGVTDQDAGNAVREEGPTVQLEAGSNMAAVLGDTMQEILWERRWNDRGQLTAEIDPEGNLTAYTYWPENDPDGDGTAIAGQASVEPRGHLRTRLVDAAATARRTSSRGPAALETLYRYDPLGHLTEERNPRGVTTRREVNALGEIVASVRGAETAEAITRGQLRTGEGPFTYERQRTYDHNGRVVQERVEDEPGVSATPGVAGWVERAYVHDINDNLVEQMQEIAAGLDAVTQYRYDANGLRTEVRHPRANQTHLPGIFDSVDTIIYDERDLPYRVTEGAGGPDAGTRQLDYDANGNLIRHTDAEDNDGDGVGEPTLYTYDGHDRRILTTTPERTERRWVHDPADNLVEEQVWGHPGSRPADPIERLRETRWTHDELNRVCRVDRDLFVVPGETPVRPVVLGDGDGDGVVSERIEHDAMGNERFRVEDDGDVTERRYDGAGRLAELHPGLGNRTDYHYDANGNLVRQVETEHSPEELVPDQVTTTYHVYDQLDRRVRSTNELGETERWSYDSRDNVTRYSDASGELQTGPDPLAVYPGVINDPGNDRTYEYDGADRVTAEVINLYVGGRPGPSPALDTTNAFNPDGQIRTVFGYDLGGNLTQVVDDNGNLTEFEYDARDRRVRQRHADNTEYTYSYDRDSNLVDTADPNGNSVQYTYDAAHRRVQTNVTRGPDVLGTTQETYSYDGLGNPTHSTDDNGGSLLANLYRTWDSLQRLLEETQGSRARQVSYRYNGDGDLTQQTYGEGKTYSRSYDALDRLESISDPDPILSDVCYIGPGDRELERELGNALRILYHDEAGTPSYDGANRLTGMSSDDPLGVPWIERAYTYDRAGRALSELRFDDADQLDEYTYDSAGRVVESRLDQWGTISRRDLRFEEFSYDGAGNRRRVVRSTASSPPVVTDYTVNNVNSYTQVGTTPQTYDANGNQTSDTFRSYEYDYRNRLVRVALLSGEEIALYTYDTEDRQTTRLFKNSAGQPLVHTESYYDEGGRLLDQWSFLHGAPFLNLAYAGPGASDVVFFEVTAPGYPFDPRTWHTRSRRDDLIGISDPSGFPLEKYVYDEYGAAYPVFGGFANPPFLFGLGGFFQSETGHYRLPDGRQYDPVTGRFTTRSGRVHDPRNGANPYSFRGNSPLVRFAGGGVLGVTAPLPVLPVPAGPAGPPASRDFVQRIVDALLEREDVRRRANRAELAAAPGLPDGFPIPDPEDLLQPPPPEAFRPRESFPGLADLLGAELSPPPPEAFETPDSLLDGIEGSLVIP